MNYIDGANGQTPGKIHFLKTPRGIILPAAGVVLLVALASVYRWQGFDHCRTCYSKRRTSEWYWGWRGEWSMPLSSLHEEVTESQFSRDFVTGEHRHEWQLHSGDYTHVLVPFVSQGLCGKQSDPSGLLRCYESTDSFRDLIQKKLRNGSLQREEFVKMLTTLRRDAPPEMLKAWKDLVDEWLNDLPAVEPGTSGRGE